MTFLVGLALVVAGLINGAKGDPFWHVFALIALGMAAIALSEWRAFAAPRAVVVHNHNSPIKEVPEQ